MRLRDTPLPLAITVLANHNVGASPRQRMIVKDTLETWRHLEIHVSLADNDDNEHELVLVYK